MDRAYIRAYTCIWTLCINRDGPCILGNNNLRLVIGHSSRGGPITMRKFPFPRIHGPDYDLCIRSIDALDKNVNVSYIHACF